MFSENNLTVEMFIVENNLNKNLVEILPEKYSVENIACSSWPGNYCMFLLILFPLETRLDTWINFDNGKLFISHVLVGKR